MPGQRLGRIHGHLLRDLNRHRACVREFTDVRGAEILPERVFKLDREGFITAHSDGATGGFAVVTEKPVSVVAGVALFTGIFDDLKPQLFARVVARTPH